MILRHNLANQAQLLRLGGGSAQDGPSAGEQIDDFAARSESHTSDRLLGIERCGRFFLERLRGTLKLIEAS
jgi:hypothetical protein